MPRKPAFSIKMVGCEYGSDLDVPRSYTQSFMKFRSDPFVQVVRTVHRDHPYMRSNESKPLLRKGGKP